MFDTLELGLEQAVRGLQAGLAEAAKDAAGGWPAIIAIVDRRGDLVCYARQDGCLELSKEVALKKAYTAALAQSDSAPYAERVLKSTGRTVEQQLGPRARSGAGGFVIKRSQDGATLGGVGVSGASTNERDETIARACIQAMGL
jgi:uncharacterized protein GlcG (DUF336 family)